MERDGEISDTSSGAILKGGGGAKVVDQDACDKRENVSCIFGKTSRSLRSREAQPRHTFLPTSRYN